MTLEGSQVVAQHDLRPTSDIRIRKGTPGRVLLGVSGRFVIEFYPPRSGGTVVRISGVQSKDVVVESQV
jgi:hypothetical protein